MRIRFELQSLSSLGEGAHRLPLNCWRFTVQYFPPAAAGRVLLDGVDFVDDLTDGGVPLVPQLAQFTVGGVRLPDGTPVNLDQVLRVTVAAGRLAQGMLIYEFLEP